MLNQDLSIVERLLAPSPKFFVIIRNALGILALVSLVITKLDAVYPLPDYIKMIGDKAVWIAGLIGTFVSLLTVDFKKLIEKEQFSNQSK